MSDFIWVEKYRPKKVEDCLLPKDLKKVFKGYLKKGVPNMVLAGPPGCGKTTVAKALLDESGASYMYIGGARQFNIDVLRTDITQFASSVSFDGKRKYVILDEADNYTQYVQKELRSFIEEFANNCGFIFICNYRDKLIDPLFSRCPIIEFNLTQENFKETAKDILLMITGILDKEGIAYDKKVVLTLIKKMYPDLRKVINKLQQYASTGEIDTGILASTDDATFDDLIQLLKSKNFTEVRKWIWEHEVPDTDIFEKLYEVSDEHMDIASIAILVKLIADYQYKSYFAANKKINTLAFFVEVMSEVTFK